MKDEIVDKIFKPIKAAGFNAFFVGGCVRDECLGIEPHDFDIVTDAKPIDLHKIFAKTIDVNSEQFGITVVDVGDGPVEIATFRKDGTSSDARHPDEVDFNATMNDDAQRRDFTINAMFMDAIGFIRDPTGFGMHDVTHHIIRFCGDPVKRIEEDPLRILRMFRFAATKGFDIDSKSEAAAVDFVKKNKGHVFDSVSAERIGVELLKTCGGIKAAAALCKMIDDDVMAEIIPEFAAERTCMQRPDFHPEGSVETHTEMVLHALQEKDPLPTTMLAALLHDIGKPVTTTPDGRALKHEIKGAEMSRAICKSLKLCRRDTDDVNALVLNHMKIGGLSEAKKPFSFAKVATMKHINELIKLSIADDEGRGATKKVDFTVESIVNRPMFQRFLRNGMPKDLITGDDLIAAGVAAGPHIKQMLEEARKIQINNNCVNKKSLIKQVIHNKK